MTEIETRSANESERKLIVENAQRLLIKVQELFPSSTENHVSLAVASLAYALGYLEYGACVAIAPGKEREAADKVRSMSAQMMIVGYGSASRSYQQHGSMQ
ncbi:MAG: hypothetical protein LW689_04410 [Novosphingobium sp.]|jgi:hypothetical protein|nr:hypothetical protein [Novosphingobium sp.]MCE2842027.1 hypothetical protein [Novosphingobium sp.]